MLKKKKDGSDNTIEPVGTRDPATGRIMGVKIGACRACGKVKRIQVATGLCGLKSCRTVREKRAKRALDRQRADEWLAEKVLLEADE